ADLWAATYVLLGLRYSKEFAQVLIRGVLGMRESVTYQAILDEGRTEGRVEEARRILLLQGEDRFGAPRAAVRSAVEAVTDVEQLERLARAVLTANSWEDLLGLPPRRRRNGRRPSSG